VERFTRDFDIERVVLGVSQLEFEEPLKVSVDEGGNRVEYDVGSEAFKVLSEIYGLGGSTFFKKLHKLMPDFWGDFWQDCKQAPEKNPGDYKALIIGDVVVSVLQNPLLGKLLERCERFLESADIYYWLKDDFVFSLMGLDPQERESGDKAGFYMAYNIKTNRIASWDLFYFKNNNNEPLYILFPFKNLDGKLDEEAIQLLTSDYLLQNAWISNEALGKQYRKKLGHFLSVAEIDHYLSNLKITMQLGTDNVLESLDMPERPKNKLIQMIESLDQQFDLIRDNIFMAPYLRRAMALTHLTYEDMLVFLSLCVEDGVTRPAESILPVVQQMEKHTDYELLQGAGVANTII